MPGVAIWMLKLTWWLSLSKEPSRLLAWGMKPHFSYCLSGARRKYEDLQSPEMGFILDDKDIFISPS